jgi:hypothetical protein
MLFYCCIKHTEFESVLPDVAEVKTVKFRRGGIKATERPMSMNVFARSGLFWGVFAKVGR